MAIDIQVKYGDERNWSFTLSDAGTTALNLTGATVEFKLRKDEGESTAFFSRSTGGTGSDFITVGTPASDGGVTIRPTPSDWSAISDFGVFVGEFKVTDSNSVEQFTKDIEVHIQEAII